MPLDPIIGGALIGGATNLVGNLFGNNSAKKEATKNREFQERMAKNAHQYEVADLKAAGLNPILSSGGSGASTPSGSTANINVPNLDLTKYASSAADTILRKKQQELVDAQINNTNAQTANTNAQTVGTNLENDIQVSKKGIKADAWSDASDLYGWGSGLVKDGIKWGGDAISDLKDEMVNSANSSKQKRLELNIKHKTMLNGNQASEYGRNTYIDKYHNIYDKSGKLIKKGSKK